MVSIYALKDGETVFYIGKTKNPRKRKSEHLSQSSRTNTKRDIRIRSVLERGDDIKLEVLKECDELEGYREEQELIKLFLHNGSPLTNSSYTTQLILSKVETQVLIMMSQDIETEQIAQLTFRSVRTIESIKLRLKKKSRMKTLTGLITWAFSRGYITL